MEKDDAKAAGRDTEQPNGQEPPAGTVQPKPYKPPSITRHGNLRLMTQLE